MKWLRFLLHSRSRKWEFCCVALGHSANPVKDPSVKSSYYTNEESCSCDLVGSVSGKIVHNMSRCEIKMHPAREPSLSLTQSFLPASIAKSFIITAGCKTFTVFLALFRETIHEMEITSPEPSIEWHFTARTPFISPSLRAAPVSGFDFLKKVKLIGFSFRDLMVAFICFHTP